LRAPWNDAAFEWPWPQEARDVCTSARRVAKYCDALRVEPEEGLPREVGAPGPARELLRLIEDPDERPLYIWDLE